MTEFNKQVMRAMKISRIIAYAIPCLAFIIMAGTSFYETGKYKESVEFGMVGLIVGTPIACLLFIIVPAILLPKIPEE